MLDGTHFPPLGFDHWLRPHKMSAQGQNGQSQDRDQQQQQQRRSNRHLQIQEPERRPLLRRHVSHEPDSEPVFSCVPNPHSHLPVYTNIHRIRRDVVSIVEDYMSLEQLRDVRINISVIRPLVDKLYDLDDISIGEPVAAPCLLLRCRC